MKNKKKVLALIVMMTVIGMTFLSGCAKEETTEYILPEMLIIAAGQTQESAIDALKPQGNKNDLVTSIREGDNGSIIVEITDKQRNRWLDDIEKTIEECEKAEKEAGCEIIINDDHTELTHKVNKEANVTTGAKNYTLVSTRCMQYQIFNGVSPDEIKLQSTIINIETGKVMVSVGFGESVTINPEDWEE